MTYHYPAVLQRTRETPKAQREKLSEKPDLYELFWVFFITCFAGVFIETLWCLLTRHQFESRVGVLYGPFNPVYGFGAVLLTICLRRLDKRRSLLIFTGSMAIGSAFEYLCSLLQEKALGTVSWEYSKAAFQIHGRTDLKYALFWGILGLIWVREIWPRLRIAIRRILKKTGKVLTWLLFAFMVGNMMISFLALQRQSERRADIPASGEIGRFLDEHYTDAYLSQKYSNMAVVDNSVMENQK